MATECEECPTNEPLSDDEIALLVGSHLETLGLPRSLFNDVVQLRRSLHRLPELAFHELQTARTLRDELASIDGVEVLDVASGGTGVLALIEGGGAGRTILLRADMDALPVAEADEDADANDGSAAKRRKMAALAGAGECCALCGGASPFDRLPSAPTSAPSAAGAATPRAVPEKKARSTVTGVSHACGHDGHMAML
eukprot:3889958-Prymnesium_polylepis.1